MINVKDVVTLRVPYPDTFSELARKSHMYICIEAFCLYCTLVKCQSFKPYHLATNSAPVCRIIEQPDIARNPFRHPTIIDLDKVFVATRSLFQDNLKTAQGVSDTLLSDIQANVDFNVARIALTNAELQAVNYKL